MFEDDRMRRGVLLQKIVVGRAFWSSRLCQQTRCGSEGLSQCTEKGWMWVLSREADNHIALVPRIHLGAVKIVMILIEVSCLVLPRRNWIGYRLLHV